MSLLNLNEWVYTPPNSRIRLKRSDLVAAKKVLGDEDWLRHIANYFEEHYKYAGRWWELIGLQQVAVGLPPLPYGNSKIRSQFHLLLRGPPGTGKSQLIYSILHVGINPIEIGEVTGPKIAGTMKDGKWIEGEAHRAKNGILILPEMSETVKNEDHYRSAITHLIQIMEDQRIARSLSQRFKKVEDEREMYPDVTFYTNGRWEYETNACVSMATWEMNDVQLIEKVSAGFYSRVFEIPLNYTKSQLFDALDTVYRNMAGLNQMTPLDEEGIRKTIEVLHCTNMGYLSSFAEFQGIGDVTIPPPLAAELISRYKDMVTRCLADLKIGDDDEGAVLPTLFREPLDGFRIACADAISRRFAGTADDHGNVEVDDRAIDTASEYLNILVSRRVETHKKLQRYVKLSSVEPEPLMGDEYRLICGRGDAGIDYSVLEEICTKRLGIAERTFRRHIEKLESEGAVSRSRNVLDARRVHLTASKFVKKQKGMLYGS